MKLVKCYIENFGMFSNHTVEFKSGLNCIYSKNSTGKTTLSVFISAMLFGFPETRKQSLEENERKKYSPWQGGTYGGSLTLEADGKKYTVERTFGQKSSDDTFILRYTDTGAVCTDYGPDIGEELFGIDRDGFLRTVFLSEKNLPVKNENKTISAKLSNLVGVDGDVGGFDEAISLLDERRKFYYKKSGSCEISKVKAKLTEKTAELDRLMAVKEKAEENEKLLYTLGEKRRALEEKKRSIAARALEEAKRKEIKAHLERYLAVKAKLDRDKQRRREIESTFGSDIPTAAMIEEARFSIIEGERILSECSKDIGDDFGELYARYERVDPEVISGAEKIASDLSSTESEIKKIEDGTDAASIRMKEIFEFGAPTDEEIRQYASSLNNKSLASKTSIIVGILAFIAGGLFGYFITPALYALTALSIVLFATGIYLNKKSRRQSGDNASLISKLGENKAPKGREDIELLKQHVAIYDNIRSSRIDTLNSLTKRREELQELLHDLCISLGITPTLDPQADVRLIRAEYTRYYAMSINAKQNADGRRQRIATAEEMIKRGRDFLSRFNTVSDNPFEELSSLITEYGYLKMSIDAAINECDNLEIRYGLSADMKISTDILTSVTDSEITECENALAEAIHEYTVIESEYERQMRQCEVIDSLESEIESLKATHSEYLDTLRIIQTTMSLLTEACDSMTSRYLGKTREGFLKYESAIGGGGGSYAVDTDFSVTKNEHGGARAEESYSRGTKDLYSLAIRLALIDALYENESPFVILDDPFTALDDERAEKAKRLIQALSKTRQILYFTCSKSRVI